MWKPQVIASSILYYYIQQVQHTHTHARTHTHTSWTKIILRNQPCAGVWPVCAWIIMVIGTNSKYHVSTTINFKVVNSAAQY